MEGAKQPNKARSLRPPSWKLPPPSWQFLAVGRRPWQPDRRQAKLAHGVPSTHCMSGTRSWKL